MAVYSKRRIHKSALEVFVDEYLSTIKNSGAARRSKKKFLEKARALLSVYIDKPCCSGDPEEFSISFTHNDDELTSFVKTELEIKNRRTNLKSYIRVYNILDNFIEKSCCA